MADKIKEGLLDKAEQEQKDYEDAAKAATSIIDDEIKRLEELKDAKQKANDETEKELELAKLQEALEKARNERTKRVKYMLSIKIAQNGETPEEDNTVGKICFEIY